MYVFNYFYFFIEDNNSKMPSHSCVNGKTVRSCGASIKRSELSGAANCTVLLFASFLFVR